MFVCVHQYPREHVLYSVSRDSEINRVELVPGICPLKKREERGGMVRWEWKKINTSGLRHVYIRACQQSKNIISIWSCSGRTES